jgi:hypothetical protein
MINIKKIDGVFICTCFVEISRLFFNTMILVQHQDARIKPKTKENIKILMILYLKWNLLENPKHPNCEHHEITTLV